MDTQPATETPGPTVDDIVRCISSCSILHNNDRRLLLQNIKDQAKGLKKRCAKLENQIFFQNLSEAKDVQPGAKTSVLATLIYAAYGPVMAAIEGLPRETSLRPNTMNGNPTVRFVVPAVGDN